MNTTNWPTLGHIREVAVRINPHITRTPVLQCSTFDHMFGAAYYFKCENFQKAGAFKTRGAVNAVLKLTELEASKGVATHSSGNHAAALSRAAAIRSIPAYIVMPRNAPQVKVEAVKSYGGIITFCEPTLQARETTLEKVTKQTGATFIPPYNHIDIIEGQGTATLELLETHPDLDIIIAPVGGGGLLSGTAVTAKGLNKKILVFGAEPEQADDAFRSFKARKLIPSVNPDTIADGLKTSLGSLTFPLIQQFVDDIFTVSEAEIIHAMRMIWERMKIIIEPSCAVPFAVAIKQNVAFKGKRIGIILSGGNVDLESLPWLKT